MRKLYSQLIFLVIKPFERQKKKVSNLFLLLQFLIKHQERSMCMVTWFSLRRIKRRVSSSIQPMISYKLLKMIRNSKMISGIAIEKEMHMILSLWSLSINKIVSIWLLAQEESLILLMGRPTSFRFLNGRESTNCIKKLKKFPFSKDIQLGKTSLYGKIHVDIIWWVSELSF